MLGKKNELDSLLKNIKDGLKKIDMTVRSALEKQHEKKPQVDFVLREICTRYDITQRMLIHSSSRGKIKEARKICCWLLHYDVGLSQRHISLSVFGYKYHNHVSQTIRDFKHLNEELKPDRELKTEYTQIQKKFIEFIKK